MRMSHRKTAMVIAVLTSLVLGRGVAGMGTAYTMPGGSFDLRNSTGL